MRKQRFLWNYFHCWHCTNFSNVRRVYDASAIERSYLRFEPLIGHWVSDFFFERRKNIQSFRNDDRVFFFSADHTHNDDADIRQQLKKMPNMQLSFRSITQRANVQYRLAVACIWEYNSIELNIKVFVRRILLHSINNQFSPCIVYFALGIREIRSYLDSCLFMFVIFVQYL